MALKYRGRSNKTERQIGPKSKGGSFAVGDYLQGGSAPPPPEGGGGGGSGISRGYKGQGMCVDVCIRQVKGVVSHVNMHKGGGDLDRPAGGSN